MLTNLYSHIKQATRNRKSKILLVGKEPTSVSVLKGEVCTATAHKAVKQTMSIVAAIKRNGPHHLESQQKDQDLRARWVDTIYQI